MTHGQFGGFHHHSGFHHHGGFHHGHHHHHAHHLLHHGHLHHRHHGLHHHHHASLAMGMVAGAVVAQQVASQRRARANAPREVWAVQASEDPLGVQSVSLPVGAINDVKGVTYFGIDVNPKGRGSSWRIMKRYNEFFYLASRLPFFNHLFPRKHLTGCQGAKLERRRQKLEMWLQYLLMDRRCRPLLREFLQADKFQVPPASMSSPVDASSAVQAPSPDAAVPTSSTCEPDLGKDPEAWFKHFDTNGNGLEQHEVIKALLQTFPATHPYAVRDFIDNLWTQFDVDASGTISLKEFLQRDGLRDAILAQMKLLASSPFEDSASVSAPLHESAQDESSVTTLEIVIPPGVQATQTIQVTVPDGREALVTVPHGYSGGMTLQFEFKSQDGTLALLS